MGDISLHPIERRPNTDSGWVLSRLNRAFHHHHWPTWLVWLATWSAWVTLTLYHQAIPILLLAVLGGWVICQYGSLQHEAIHGHLTNTRWLQRLCVGLPLGLVFPLSTYRHSHMQHHGCQRLTEPHEDPESFYHRRQDWQQYPRVLRALLIINQTLLGRLVVGPWIAIVDFCRSQWRAYRTGDRKIRRIWLAHAGGITLVLAWALGPSAMPVWKYLLCFVWPGLSLTLLRSFHEHRAAEVGTGRIQTVEAAWPFRLLFFNNNYHVLHHARPDLPWYRLHRLYWETKERDIAATGRPFGGYAEIARRFFLAPKDSPVL